MKRISPEAAPVARFLAQGGAVHTRLRETSRGDRHDLPLQGSRLLSMSLEAEAVLGALEELEELGVVVRSEAVSRWDSAEYLVTWRAVWPNILLWLGENGSAGSSPSWDSVMPPIAIEAR